MSKTSSPRRHNKLYRCPPTPPNQDLLHKEKGFVIDSVAVSSVSTDYSKCNPKLGPVIPPYNSHKDKHVQNYFDFIGVKKTLKKTGQDQEQGTSIEGRDIDKFHNRGAGHVYSSLRNQNGGGHSRELVDGHAQFMQGIKPITGYNGKYGYRRNTPWVRITPSPFGTATTSPTH